MNLEQFPTSETGKKMLGYVTGNGFYENSYVGKWIFQVMGQELDEVRKIVEALPYQAFVETATWGLRYHEEKYGLPISENLPMEERRKRIIEKRDMKAPMTPWRMENILKSVLGCDVKVSDVHDGGEDTLQHPNQFRVLFQGEESSYSIRMAFEKLDMIKQSHTFYELHIRLVVFELIEIFTVKVSFRMGFFWWSNTIFDGKQLFNGRVLMNARLPPYFIACFRTIVKNEEKIVFLPERYCIFIKGTYANLSFGRTIYCASAVLRERVSVSQILLHTPVRLEEALFLCKAICTVPCIKNEAIVHFNKLIMSIIALSNKSKPTVKRTLYRNEFANGENFHISVYSNFFFSGRYVMDGRKKLNSIRREEL